MTAFTNPANAGTYDLKTSQVNQGMVFRSVEGVFLSNARIDFYFFDRHLKTYRLGQGLTLVGTNEQGTSKQIDVLLNGADFEGYEGREVRAECSFFNQGDIEAFFKLNIV